jgi:hypothetical protein
MGETIFLGQNAAATERSFEYAAEEAPVFAPARQSDAYAYGFKITSDAFFRGGAAQKSYLLSVSGDRTSAYAATGDSNDALIRATGSNYAANDTNFIMRPLNATFTNRSGGTLGILESLISIQAKSGGTVGTMRGLTVKSENYGVVSDEFGGLDVIVHNEAAVATLEYGIRIRNTNNSITGPVDTAVLLTKSGTNTGFTHLLVALDDGKPAASTCASVSAIGTKGYLKVKIGSATRYIGLSETVT